MLDMTSAIQPPTEAIDARVCDHCAKTFTPRTGNGGKPQRFCNAECKAAFHTEAQRSQRSPTYSDKTAVAAGQVAADHKTESTGEQTATQQRRVLINGTEDFWKRCPEDRPQNGETAEECVDRTLASGKLKTSEPDSDGFDWSPGNGAVVFNQQDATAVYMTDGNEVAVVQRRWPDDDVTLFFQAQNVIAVAKRMLAVAGYGNVQLYRESAGGACEDIE